MAKILYLADSYWGSTWYRCHVPGMELKRRGHEVILTDKPMGADVDTCDVLAVQRLNQPVVLEIIDRVKARGVRTVFDVDDDYWTLHPENPAREAWQRPGALDGLAACMRACDMVTTTTAALADSLKRFNPRVRVLPNMLPSEHWPATRKDVSMGSDGPLVIGWAGSSSHKPDMGAIRDLAPYLLERYPHIELHLAGAQDDWLEPHDRIKIVPFVKIEQYATLLSGFDIALAPLADNKFNQAKSDLKLIEYGMVGLPIVASKVGPYLHTVKHGENALFAKSPKDWLKHLSRLIEDGGLRDQLGSGARETAEKRLISGNIERWEKAYGVERPDS